MSSPQPPELVVQIGPVCTGTNAFMFEVSSNTDLEPDRLFWRPASIGPVTDEPVAGSGNPVEAGVSYAHSAFRAGDSVVVLKDGDDEQVVAAAHADLLAPDCESGPQVERIAGSTRAETAAAVAMRFYMEYRVVYLASGEQFPDALTLGGIPPREVGPVLLTGRDTLPEATRTALEQLQPRYLRVLGGPNAISEAVLAAAAEAAGLSP